MSWVKREKANSIEWDTDSTLISKCRTNLYDDPARYTRFFSAYLVRGSSDTRLGTGPCSATAVTSCATPDGDSCTHPGWQTPLHSGSIVMSWPPLARGSSQKYGFQPPDGASVKGKGTRCGGKARQHILCQLLWDFYEIHEIFVTDYY